MSGVWEGNEIVSPSSFQRKLDAGAIAKRLEDIMPEGGFLVKFDGKETFRCHKVSFDYDFFTYQINNEEPKPFPEFKGYIEVICEEENYG